METIIQTILQISISMAVVIGILLLLVPVWQKHYSARWRKIIWLIIAVRLLVPFSIELPAAPVQMNMDLEQPTTVTRTVTNSTVSQNDYKGEIESVSAQTAENGNEQAAVTANKPAFELESDTYQESVSRGTILFCIWLLGLTVFASFHIVQYQCFRRSVKAFLEPIEDGSWIMHHAGEGLNLRRYPDVWMSTQIQSPMLIGFIKPVILLSERIYGEQELLLILRHELTHYKHHDLWYKLILLLANAVHWFNPLVYWMVRQAGRDVEQVCDNFVVAGQDMAYRKAYSMTILNTMANQRGMALSTYLSKDAQNTKKRFAAILQPKHYKKGIVVFCGVFLLAVIASGCLQLGEVDKGLKAYKQVAEFLPDDAIYNPEEYEVIGEEDDEYLMYIWIEGAYEVTEKEAKEARMNEGALSYGRDGKEYLYDRALMLWVSQKDGRIASVGYDNRTMDAVKPSEIGRDKEARDAYVQKIAKTLIENYKDYTFQEGEVITDGNNNAIRGAYASGNMADIESYAIRLNYQHGYLEQLVYYGPDAWTAERVYRMLNFTQEGLPETMETDMNRRPDWYVLFTDVKNFNSQIGGMDASGCFADKYVFTGDNEATPVKTYMAVSYTPDCTIEEWRKTETVGKIYACMLPQTQPGEEWTPGWKRTGQTKIFPEDPNRIWQVLKPSNDIPGIHNSCYATSYRGGIMAAYISYPNEYAEGWGSRMHTMLDTLVLAAREDNSQKAVAVEDEGIALYNKVAPWLPEHAVSDPNVYEKKKILQSGCLEYIWDQDHTDMSLNSEKVEPDYPQGLTIRIDENTREILYFHYWHDDTQRALPEADTEFKETLAPRREYVQKFVETFIENGEQLTAEVDRADPDRELFFIQDEKKHYEYHIAVNKQYGGIWFFNRQYKNKELKEQAIEYLKEKYRKNVSGKNFEVTDYILVEHGERQQMLDGNQYELYLGHNLEWTPVISEQQQEKLKRTSEETQKDYQKILSREEKIVDNQLYQYPMLLKITSKVTWNGKLDMSSLELYDGTKLITEEYWQQLNDKLEISWTAASYAGAWALNKPERMSLYGVTEGLVFSDENYHVYLPELVTQAEMALRNQNIFEDVWLQMPILIEGSDSIQYLNMRLEKQNNEWYVSEADWKEQ